MNEILKCLLEKNINCNPVWFMRQAGRYLPEFMKIRKQNSDFIKLCLNSELAKEITIQPVNRFDIDAAIIFSDILMIRRPPRSTQSRSSAASDVYKRQIQDNHCNIFPQKN